MNILQTTDLKKYYGTEPNITKALDGVTLSIEEGEFWYTQPLEKWFLMQLFTILYFLCLLSQLLFYWSAWQLPS